MRSQSFGREDWEWRLAETSSVCVGGGGHFSVESLKLSRCLIAACF